MPDLIINQVSKNFGRIQALDRVSFHLTEGVYGLLGPNGSGKSTLMNIISGILPASSGTVEYRGKKERLKANVSDMAYLPQTAGFYPIFTALEQLLYVSAMLGIKAEAESRCLGLLQEVNLYEAKDQKIRTFSGGMKQRLAIAQTFLSDASLILLDEPMSGLDIEERIRFRNLLVTHATGKIMLISTHIVTDLDSMVDKLLLLRKGQLLFFSEPNTLLRQLDQKVWEVTIPFSEYESFTREHFVSKVSKQNDHLYLRYILGEGELPLPQAAAVKPDFEDLSLYCFKE